MSDTVYSGLARSHCVARFGVVGEFFLDENVITQFPLGTRVISVDRCGRSTWTTITHITGELADGTPKRYFIKSGTENAGQAMMEGEFGAMTDV